MKRKFEKWFSEKYGCESCYTTPTTYFKRYIIPRYYVDLWNKVWKVLFVLFILSIATM